MQPISYNFLPSPTWRWMGLNSARAVLSLPENRPQQTLEGALCPGDAVPVDGSAGPELSAFLTDAGLPWDSYVLPQGAQGTLRLDFADAAGRACLLAGAGSKLTVITRILPGNGQSIQELSLRAEEGAQVEIVQLVDAGSGKTCLSLGIEAGASAKVSIRQIVLSGTDTALGARTVLRGIGANLDARIAYLAGDGQHVDMNWVVPHFGARSESRIQCDGVLMGTGSKLFRGTIDFRAGCTGARGAENEDVLLLSPDVHNQTIPVILCAEEDVSGTHGASIGRLSQELLYYLSSRGLGEEDITALLTRSRLSACGAQIRDTAARTWLMDRLGEEN